MDWVFGIGIRGTSSSILFFKIDFELPSYSSWIILIKYLTLYQENKLGFLDENLLENCIFKPIFFQNIPLNNMTVSL